jgi:hypothetical protein
MIYRMMLDVEAKLHKRGFPVTCIYGGERLNFEGFTSNLFRFERDPDQPDVVGYPRGSVGLQDKPLRAIRSLATRVVVYGQSPLAGAMLPEHEHECEQLVDAAIVAIAEWAVESRASVLPLEITEARFVTDATDRKAVYAEGWPGVVYALRFKMPRAVRALTYVSGAAPGLPRPKGTPTDAENDLRVQVAGGAFE